MPSPGSSWGSKKSTRKSAEPRVEPATVAGHQPAGPTTPTVDRAASAEPATSSATSATRAQAHLRDGLACTNGFVLPLPEVLVPLAAGRFDAESALTDPETREAVRDLLVALAAWTRRLGAADVAVASSRGRRPCPRSGR